MYLLRLLLTALLTLFPSTSATLWRPLGINCRGSAWCHNPRARTWLTLPYVRHMLFIASLRSESEYAALPDGNMTMYHRDMPIVCQQRISATLTRERSGICLFMQGNVPEAGVPLYRIIDKLANLDQHGCDTCGSIPLGDNNDPRELGELTMNYVGRIWCPVRRPCHCLTRKESDGLVECSGQKPAEWHTTPDGWEVYGNTISGGEWWSSKGNEDGGTWVMDADDVRGPNGEVGHGNGKHDKMGGSVGDAGTRVMKVHGQDNLEDFLEHQRIAKEKEKARLEKERLWKEKLKAEGLREGENGVGRTKKISKAEHG